VRRGAGAGAGAGAEFKGQTAAEYVQREDGGERNYKQLSCFTCMLYDWSHIEMQPVKNDYGNKTNGILFEIFAG